MSDLDPENHVSPPDSAPPKLQPLEYLRPQDADQRPRGVHAFLIFSSGMLVAFLVVGVGALSLGIYSVVAGSGNGGHLAVGFGVLYIFSAIGVAFYWSILHREGRGTIFVLGLLCGTCITLLLEGLCFTGVGLNS